MANPWYTRVFNAIAGMKVKSQQLRAELDLIVTGFDGVKATTDALAPKASPAFTGTPTAPTAANGTSTTQLATTQFVANLSLAQSLPGQAGKAGQVLITDGANASWTNAPNFVNPQITNYTETVYAPPAGSAFTVDLANGTVQQFTTNANCTITLPAAAAGKSYTIDVIYGGAHTITWAGGTNLRWPGGSAPTATSSAGKRDKFAFQCTDATNTHGSAVGQNYAA